MHIGNMFLASNRRLAELEELDNRQKEHVRQLVDLMQYGLGPRAVITLRIAAQAWSLMFPPEADYAEGPALARVVIPTLRHRVKPRFDWEERYLEIKSKPSRLSWRSEPRPVSENNTGLLDRMLADFCIATAPKTNEYRRLVAATLEQVMQERGW
jgi:hypothetical protein